MSPLSHLKRKAASKVKTKKFQRKPFIVDAVQVTSENLEELAKWTKGEIRETDSRVAAQLKKPVLKWVEIETQGPINDKQKQAHVGDWVLFHNNGFKIYTDKAFKRTFESVFQEAEDRFQGHIHSGAVACVSPCPKAGELREAKIHVEKKTPAATKLAGMWGETVEGISFTHNHDNNSRCNSACPVHQAKALVSEKAGANS